MKNRNPELLEKAKQAKSAGELSDDELDNIAGGGCGGSSKVYPEVGQTVRVGGGFQCTSCKAVEGVVMSKYKNAGASINLDVKCNACGNVYTIMADCKNAYVIL